MADPPGSWCDSLGASLSPKTRKALSQLTAQTLPPGLSLFHPGGLAGGFVVVLSGRIEVFLTAHSGREILLYAVEPGQSCIQTTLGLLGEETYTGSARCLGEVRAITIPRALFLQLMGADPGFRHYVHTAFGRRMRDLTVMLERVAFGRIEPRLAQELLDLAQDGRVTQTQEALATRIGSVREVITRHLRDFAGHGLIRTARGRVEILDARALRRIAAGDL